MQPDPAEDPRQASYADPSAFPYTDPPLPADDWYPADPHAAYDTGGHHMGGPETREAGTREAGTREAGTREAGTRERHGQGAGSYYDDDGSGSYHAHAHGIGTPAVDPFTAGSSSPRHLDPAADPLGEVPRPPGTPNASTTSRHR